jgi:hypothetical protein
VTPEGLPRLIVAAALPVILSGCAVAAIPLAAGALVANGEMGDVAGIGLGGEQTSGAETPPSPAPRIAIFAPETTPRAGLSSSAAYRGNNPGAAKPAVAALPSPAVEATPSAPLVTIPATTIEAEPAAPGSAPVTEDLETISKPIAESPTRTATEPKLVAVFPGALPPPTASTPRRIPPVIATGDDPYRAFARYALAQAAPMAPGQVRRSALIDQSTLAAQPRLADCGDQPLAVVVDLDPGTEPFNLDNPPAPAPGLAENLTAIRNAGITVLWSASLPVASAERLYTVLSASGLDPARTDRLLLERNEDERKQTRRQSAGHDWCILAVAGDRRADFDEVFDYLRDPDGPVAQALDPNFGAGWFLAPPPID